MTRFRHRVSVRVTCVAISGFNIDIDAFWGQHRGCQIAPWQPLPRNMEPSHTLQGHAWQGHTRADYIQSADHCLRACSTWEGFTTVLWAAMDGSHSTCPGILKCERSLSYPPIEQLWDFSTRPATTTTTTTRYASIERTRVSSRNTMGAWTGVPATTSSLHTLRTSRAGRSSSV